MLEPSGANILNGMGRKFMSLDSPIMRGILLLKFRGATLVDELKLLYAVMAAGAKYVMGIRGITPMLPGKSVVVLRGEGLTFYVRPNTSDLIVTLFSESYELRRWFLPHAKGIVVDVGAYIGGYTIRACKQADLVIAIEPQEENYRMLKRNVEANCKNNVILVRKAIGDRKGLIKLVTPPNFHAGTHIVFQEEGSNAYEVEVDTLDNILSELGINKVDFLKIDIEGAEVMAFKGMVNTLKRTKYLFIELRRETLWLLEEFQRLGFKVLDRKDYLDFANYFLQNLGLEK